MAEGLLPMPKCRQCDQDATHAAMGAMVRQMYSTDAVWLCPRDTRVLTLLAERFGHPCEVMPRWEYHSRFETQH